MEFGFGLLVIEFQVALKGCHLEIRSLILSEKPALGTEQQEVVFIVFEFPFELEVELPFWICRLGSFDALPGRHKVARAVNQLKIGLGRLILDLIGIVSGERDDVEVVNVKIAPQNDVVKVLVSIVCAPAIHRRVIDQVLVAVLIVSRE